MAGVGFLFLLSAAFLSRHFQCRGETVVLKIEYSLECSREPFWQSISIVPVLSTCKTDYICHWKC